MPNTTLTTAELLQKECRHTETALSDDAIAQLLPLVEGWAMRDAMLCKSYHFHDYHETLAYVNALAYVIHDADHHPELVVTYNRCTVKFNTHSVNGGKGGMSENDFICAARAEALYQQTFASAA